jgi:hypothetical protein
VGKVVDKVRNVRNDSLDGGDEVILGGNGVDTHAQFLLDCVENVLDRPINGVVGRTENNAMAFRKDELPNQRTPVTGKVVRSPISCLEFDPSLAIITTPNGHD